MSTPKTVLMSDDFPEPLCDQEWHQFDLSLAELHRITSPTTRILNRFTSTVSGLQLKLYPMIGVKNL